MDELLELSYRTPISIMNTFPIGAYVYFSIVDKRIVIGHLGKSMVYLQHRNGTQCLYNAEKDLKNLLVVKNPTYP